MTDRTWNLIDESLENAPSFKAGGLGYTEIDKLSKNYGVTLDVDHREFIHRYGAAVVGSFTIFGIGTCKMMGVDEDSVFKITQKFKDDQWMGVENWLIFSMDFSGNPVGITEKGEVWISDVVNGCVDKLEDSFEDYILEWCFDSEEE